LLERSVRGVLVGGTNGKGERYCITVGGSP
jgi:hypothetical protein